MKMVLRGPLDKEAALRIADLEIVQAEDEEALLAASADAEIAVMMNMGWLGGGFPKPISNGPLTCAGSTALVPESTRYSVQNSSLLTS